MGNVYFKEETYEGLSPEEYKHLKLYRGDIVMIDLGYGKDSIGSEQRGYRPAIIIQNNIGNTYSPTIIVAMITTKDKTYIPTHMHVDLYEPSTIMTEQIRTVDKRRVHKKIGRLKTEFIEQLNHRLLVSLGLVENYTYTGSSYHSYNVNQ